MDAPSVARTWRGLRIAFLAATVALARCGGSGGGGGGDPPPPPPPPPPAGPSLTHAATGADGKVVIGDAVPQRTIEILDAITDAPVAGVEVWVAEDEDDAVAWVEDPAGRYPPSLVPLVEPTTSGLLQFTTRRVVAIGRNLLPREGPRSLARVDSALMRFLVDSVFLFDQRLTLLALEVQEAVYDVLDSAVQLGEIAVAGASGPDLAFALFEHAESVSLARGIKALRAACYTDDALVEVFLSPFGGLVVLPVNPPASAPGAFATVVGSVRAAESGAPVAGAQVALVPAGLVASSAADRTFSLPAVPVPCGGDPGVSLIVEAEGRLPTTLRVELVAPTTGPVRVELSPATADLGTGAVGVHTSGTGFPVVFACATDGLGRAFVTGSFETSATFDAGLPSERTVTAAGFGDVFLARLAADGTAAWARRDGGTSSEAPEGLCAFPDGRTVVVGRFDGTTVLGSGDPAQTTLTAASSDVEGFVACYEADGALRWARAIGGTNADRCAAVAARADGACVVVGTFRGTISVYPQAASPTLTSRSSRDVFVACFDADGGLRWLRHGAPSGSAGAELGGVAVVDGTDVLVAGETTGTLVFDAGTATELALPDAEGEVDGFVVRLDPDGHPTWGRLATGTGRSELRAVATHADGSFAVTGLALGEVTFGRGEAHETSFDTGASSAGFVAGYGADGTFRWVRRSAGSTPHAVAALDDGAVVTVGYQAGTTVWGAGGPDETTLTASGQAAWFVVHEGDGALRAAWVSSGTTATVARAVARGPAGRFVAGGYASGTAQLPVDGATATVTSAPPGIAFVLRRKGEAP
ncbi:MAG: hypothetical protein IT460_13340 [Planctomycetes bacterium]|nr:hypothetical protein [Planctomycetota bacterium]